MLWSYWINSPIGYLDGLLKMKFKLTIQGSTKMRVYEVKVPVTSGDVSESYVMRVLGSAVELGSALIDAAFRYEDHRVESGQEDT